MDNLAIVRIIFTAHFNLSTAIQQLKNTYTLT